MRTTTVNGKPALFCVRVRWCRAGWCVLALLIGWPCHGADPLWLDDAGAVAAVFDRVGERLELMPAVAAAKWQSGAPIQDAAREQAVIDGATAAAESMGLAGGGVRQLVTLQVRLARDSQARLLGQWKSSGCDDCARSARLGALRERLDRLAGEFLRAIYIAAPALEDAGFSEQYAALAEQRLQATIPDATDRTELLAALGAIRRASPPQLKRIRASGVLRIAASGDYPPFSLSAGGRVRGVDIDLGQSLARHLRVEPVFVATSWSTLLQDLAADRFDIAVGGVSITPDRSAAGLFSLAYHSGGKTIVARCSDGLRFDGVAALDQPAVRVVVNPGGTNERYVRENLHAARILMHPDNRTIFDEIIAGRADAMITDDVEANLQTRRHHELCRTLPGTLTRADKAMLMVPDERLRTAVDSWLKGQIAAGVPPRLIERFVAP